MKRPAVLGMALRARKVFGTFEKRAPVAKSARTIHLQPAKKKQNSPLCPVSVTFFVVGYILNELKASFCWPFITCLHISSFSNELQQKQHGILKNEQTTNSDFCVLKRNK